MIDITEIRTLEASVEFQLDMVRLAQEQEAEKREEKPSCCLCGKEMKSSKNAACGGCLA